MSHLKAEFLKNTSNFISSRHRGALLAMRSCAFVALALLTSQCGLMGLGSTLGETEGSGIVNGSGPNGFTGGSQEDGSSASSSGGNALPPASMPAPALKKMIVPASDTSSYVPVIGFDEAIALSVTDAEGNTYQLSDNNGDGLIDDHYVIASSSSLLAAETSVTTLKKQNASVTKNIVVEQNTYCSDWDPSEAIPYLGTNSSGQEYTCCSITTSGSFECFIPKADNNITAYVYVTDGSYLSEGVEDQVNPNFLYLGQNLKDIQPTEVFSVSQETLVEDGLFDSSYMQGKDILDLDITLGLGQTDLVTTIYTEGEHHVVGSPASRYLQWEADSSATKIAYDATQNVLGNLNPTSGVGSYAMNFNSLWDTSSSMTKFRSTTSCENTEEYKLLKYTSDGQLRFARKPTTPENRASLKVAISSDCSTDEIDYFHQTTFDADALLVSTDIHVYDITPASSALVLYQVEDSSGTSTQRLRYKFEDGGTDYLSGGDTEFEETGTWIDLQVMVENTLNHSGQALLLDGQGRIGVIDFSAPEDSVAVNQWVDLGSEKTPVGFVLNSDKTIAYVLNAGDKTVSILNLQDMEAISTSTINISDYFDSKEMTYTPKNISFTTTADGSEYLHLTLEGLKGALVVEL